MRTITNGNILAQVTGIQVLIHDGSTWIDLASPVGTSFPGKSRVHSLSFEVSRDRGTYTGTIRFLNHPQFRQAGESLDPGHESMFNPGGVPLIGAYHRINILIGKGGTAPALMFDGFVGQDEVRTGEDVEGNDFVEVGLVGVMQPYADFYVDEQNGNVYTDTYISKAVERDMLNQILVDYGFAEDVVIEDDPEYYVYRYQIGDVSILEALQRPVQGIGFCLEERYHAASGTFRPTVVDPDRANTTPDLYLGGNIRATRIAYTEANVRTWIRVVYRDRVTGKEAHTDAKNETARMRYGVPDGRGGRQHRYMRLVEKDASLIDTRAEAQQVADFALHDLSSPSPAAEVEIPWLVLGVELGDLVTVETPSETINIGVTELSWTLGAGDVLGSTMIRGAIDRRVGARRYWFSRARTDWAGKHDRDRDEQRGAIPTPPTHIEAQGLWGENEDGSSAPVLHVRWAGVRNWNTKGYRVRYRTATLYDSGTATGGTTTTLIDTGKSWTTGELTGAYLILETTTRATHDRVRQIRGNVGTTLLFSPALTVAVEAGEAYLILLPDQDWTMVATDVYPFVQVKGLPEGKYVVAEVATVPYRLGR